MQDIPECLSRRYKALDEFISELNTNEKSPQTDCSTDPSIRLLCNFWDILKDDPDVNLSRAVEQRMCADGVRSVYGQHINCYMAGCCKKNDGKKQETNKDKPVCAKPSSDTTEKPKCRVSKSSKSTLPNASADELPLNKVLCNLKEAASFEKKCQGKVNDLLETQKQLQDQIQVLEEREKNGVQLLKQADCMWSCMEETYKKKIAESLERQKELSKQLKEVETSNTKWRKNKKDLEFQMDNINKCHQEITEKINQKTSDVKCIDMEIDNYKKRIENNKKELDVVKKSFGTKKQASDKRIANITNEVTKLEKILADEQKYKKLKEVEGSKYVREAREDLQKLCKVLLQKKLENEDLKAEGENLLLEVDVLKENYDQCKEKCKNKQESIEDEIKSIDKEIAEFKLKCIQCHVCTDTVDVRKFCTDCPRCVDQRDCLYEGDHCSPDSSMDCVCTVVKEKFLDNVFDNMYTVLERQIKSGPGKAVADVVLNCLKKSRNGKLNAETRKILQDFILTTVKKNLNLTIVGGAVKTRCEMDAETYKQLMLCLKQIKVTKPVKVDQGTESKKEPCRRFGGTSECNCPKGPKECICSKKAPQHPNEPTSCPPKAEDKEDAGQVVTCPYKETTACGPDCAMHELPNSVGSEVASWRPDPCQGPTCQFKNMRAAQCVLGPEALTTFSDQKILRDELPSKCSNSSTDPYVSFKDTKQVKAEKQTICDNDTCKTEIEAVVDEKSNFVGQIKQNATRECMKDTQINKNVLNDANPIIFKGYSGDLKIALNEKIIEEINKHLQEGTNVYVTLKKTDDGKVVFSLNSDVTEAHDNKIFLPKKSASGSIILEAYKPINKQPIDKLNIELQSKIDKDIQSTEMNEKVFNSLSKGNESEKVNTNTSKRRNSRRESCTKIGRDIHKAKVKGVQCKKEPIFALKETASGNFKIVLDKEYERYNMRVIKEYECDNCVEYARLQKSNSGNFVINFNDNKDNDATKALIVKTESGSLKILVDKPDSDSNVQSSRISKSIMTANALNKLLNKSTSFSEEPRRSCSQRLQLPHIKSHSDSNICNKEKNDFSVKNKQTFHKAIATSCNSRYNDSSCNKAKCVCKNICYKSKQWFWENSICQTGKKACGVNPKKQTENLLDNLNKSDFIWCKENNDVQVFKNLSQTDVRPCGCNSVLESKEQHFCSIEDSYQYHFNKYESISNELPDSVRYNKGFNLETYNESDNRMKDVPNNLHWDSLEYFPPQLPPFLRDFTYV